MSRNIQGTPVVQEAAYQAAVGALQTGAGSELAAAAAMRAAAAIQPMPPSDACQICGAMPAAKVSIHKHSGYLLLFSHSRVNRHLCRDCGLSLWRASTNSTLLRGWLGLMSFFLAPLTVLWNLIAWQRLSGLRPVQAGTRVRPYLPSGSSLLQRPGVYVYGALVLLIAFRIATAH